MILTRSHLAYMQRYYGFKIDKPLSEYLYSIYSYEPFPYEYSEQDLYEQIRKLVIAYDQGNLDISIKSSAERMKNRYESLKQFCVDILSENSFLNEENCRLKAILKKNGIQDKDKSKSNDF